MFILSAIPANSRKRYPKGQRARRLRGTAKLALQSLSRHDGSHRDFANILPGFPRLEILIPNPPKS